MGNKAINYKTFLSSVLMCGFSCLSFAQSNNTKKQVQFVFDQLISVYGSAKSAPKLIVQKKRINPILPANYTTLNGPKIQIDEALYKVCQTFGKDSLNVLAIVVSHELTHYFNDHKFCSDYAYANFKKKNPNLKIAVSEASLSARKDKETEADIKGFFFAAAAGFKPFGLQEKLIDNIYKAYNLSDIQKGYPSRQERKQLAKGAEDKAKELFGYFQEGLKAMEEKKYDDAIISFDKANSFIPYRENFNNMGVARTIKALKLKVITSEEKHYPDRFLYPVEVDNTSRLNDNYRVRGVEDSNQEQMNLLLKSAQKDFEKAISLDSKYTKSYINLACVFSLLNNPEAAIGKIKELPKEEQETPGALRILAIAYYDTNEEKAKAIWKMLKI